MYQVVVESHGPVKSRGRREAAPAETSPCDLPHSELVDFSTAQQRGLHCYVAAELPTTGTHRPLHFEVGDNRTYGGFYNAPLEKGAKYDVWFGVKIMVDGETAASYAKMEVSVVRKYHYLHPCGGHERSTRSREAG